MSGDAYFLFSVTPFAQILAYELLRLYTTDYSVGNRLCSLAREHKDLNKWLLFVFSAPVTGLEWNNTRLTVDIGVQTALRL